MNTFSILDCSDRNVRDLHACRRDPDPHTGYEQRKS